MGHYPVRFPNMLEDHGPVITAVHLVMAHRDPVDFESLIVSQRLDLTVEALFCKSHISGCSLLLKKAKNKLREVGYSSDARKNM